jgi:hypothetical protein
VCGNLYWLFTTKTNLSQRQAGNRLVLAHWGSPLVLWSASKKKEEVN